MEEYQRTKLNLVPQDTMESSGGSRGTEKEKGKDQENTGYFLPQAEIR